MILLGTRSPIAFSEWTVFAAPAVTTRAAATIAAAGVGIRRIMDAFSLTLSCVAAQAEIECVIRDGASLAGTILWQMGFNGPAGQHRNVQLSCLNITGSPNTAMTIEFLTAPAASNFQRVCASGFNAT